MRRTCVRRWILLVSLTQFLAVVGWVAYVHAQTQETMNAMTTFRLTSVEGRVAILENQNTEGRLNLLEADMAEVKWLGRSVAALVASQLITMLMGMRERRHQR